MDVKQIKKDFPIFKNNPGLTYLDSTATSLKPQSVINKIAEYYTQYGANVARGLYKISEKATQEYELTREAVAKFINATSSDEIIFTRSTTESINLITYSLGRELVKESDEIVVTVMEHHSNFVPWQQLAFSNGADFKVIDITDEGYLSVILSEVDGSVSTKNVNKIPPRASLSRNDRLVLENIITKKTKILALTYMSNVLGTINPVAGIIKAAKKINPKIIIVVDAAQAVPHMKVDVKALGADFVAFSSHKMMGPTGVGVLWGRYELLDKMFPFNYGGEMIEEVYIDHSTYHKPPHKFEAGTPHIDGVIGLRAAIEYLDMLGFDEIRKHEIELTRYAFDKLKKTFGEELNIIGPKKMNDKGGILTFTFKGVHPHDVAQILDDEGIAVRSGHHCAMPLHTRLGLPATSRASFYVYNDEQDVDKLVTALQKVKKIFS